MQDNTKIQSYYTPNTKFDRVALAQVYEILMGYEDGIENVPEQIMRFLEDNMDKNYIFDYGDDLESFQLERDAENLLIYIYTKYLATEEERETIENMAKMQKNQEEQQKQKLYPTEIFSSNQRTDNGTQKTEQKNVLPVEYKESIFTKIVKFFKKIFQRKR